MWNLVLHSSALRESISVFEKLLVTVWSSTLMSLLLNWKQFLSAVEGKMDSNLGKWVCRARLPSLPPVSVTSKPNRPPKPANGGHTTISKHQSYWDHLKLMSFNVLPSTNISDLTLWGEFNHRWKCYWWNNIRRHSSKARIWQQVGYFFVWGSELQMEQVLPLISSPLTSLQTRRA